MKYNTPSRYKGKWFNNSLACIKISRYRKSPRTTIRKVGKLLFISGAKPGKNTSCLIYMYVTRTNVGGGAWYRPITSVSLLWYFFVSFVRPTDNRPFNQCSRMLILSLTSASFTLLLCAIKFRSVGLNLPISLIGHCTACFTGLVVVSYYTSIGCDPLANGEIRKTNQVMNYYT